MTLPSSYNTIIDKIAQKPAHGYLVVGNQATDSEDFISKLAITLSGAASKGEQAARILRLPLEKNGSVGKKSVDEMVFELSRKQTETTRIAIINDISKLSLAAQNSLLKTIEEPGDNTVLLLACSNRQAAPSTVSSRLQVINLPTLNKNDVIDKFHKHDQELVAKLAMATGFDSIAIKSTLEDQTEIDKYMNTIALAKKILAASTYDRFIFAKPFWKDRDSLSLLVNVMTNLCHAAAKASRQNSTKTTQWYQRIEVLLKAKSRLKASVSPRLIIAELMIQL